MKKCKECETEFTPSRVTQEFCSKRCSFKVWLRNNRDRMRELHRESDARTKDRRKEWEKDNAAHLKDYKRRHYLKNRQRYIQKAVENTRSDLERNREKQKRYRNSDKGREAGYNGVARRRARKLAAGGNYTRKEFRELCAKYDHRCLCCGERFDRLEADHVTPLSRGGNNGIENIQPLCRRCNRKKGDREIDYRPRWKRLEHHGDDPRR